MTNATTTLDAFISSCSDDSPAILRGELDRTLDGMLDSIATEPMHGSDLRALEEEYSAGLELREMLDATLPGWTCAYREADYEEAPRRRAPPLRPGRRPLGARAVGWSPWR